MSWFRGSRRGSPVRCLGRRKPCASCHWRPRRTGKHNKKMTRSSWRSIGRRSVLTAAVLIAAVDLAPPADARAVQPGVRTDALASEYTISGRVLDPKGLKTKDAILQIWRRDPDGEGSSGVPVPTAADGSFVTARVPSGTYLLEVVRTPYSTKAPATTVGLRMVTVTGANVDGADVEVHKDFALQGRFHMESDNPRAPWPPHIVVNAFVALHGTSLWKGTVADGAPGGRFVLRNAFGPRVVRPGYSLEPGVSWWPSRVLLDGKDVTNIPTDFSHHPNAQLEVVFTQHRAGLDGIVQTADGRPAPGAWVMLCAADPKLREAWATTSHAVRTDPTGRFRITTLPGSYLARAYAPNAFASRAIALQHLADIEAGAQAVQVAEREFTSMRLILREGAAK